MTMTTNLRTAALSTLAGGALVALGLILGPAGAAHAADRNIDLYALSGSAALPAAGGGTTSVPVWGYCDPTVAGADCTAPVTAPGGPTLRVTQGQTVQITLHNTLPEATALYVGGQAMVPDTTGAAASTGTKVYSFTASRAGTYLYEAGVLGNNEHQVAMGLYGALVVQSPTPGQAYDATTTFDSESVLVLGEIDPALNTRSPLSSFDMRAFAPKWTVINGKAAPATAPMTAASGSKVLIRWVNAAPSYHSMSVLGADQRVVAFDGSQLRNATDISRTYAAETYGPGQTADAIVTVPTTAANRRLAVYDASLTLHDNTAPGTGGMLTFINVTGTGTGSDVTGPATRTVTWTGGALAATVDATALAGPTVSGAEYFVDAVGAGGTGSAMDPTDGTFNGVTEAVRPTTTGGTALAAQLATGQHIVYVHGRVGAGPWGPFSSVLVTGSDSVGPATSAVALDPGRTNGSVAVTVTATGDDTASGGSAIAGAEWAIDGGTATAMTVGTAAPQTSLSGVIPAATVTALAEGTHTVTVRSRDSAGNWGPTASAALVVDRTAPTVSGVSVVPSPNNGTIPVNASSPAVRLSATVTDPAGGGDGTAQSPIVRAEAYLDGGSTPIPMDAADGAFSSSTENVTTDIPLTTVKQLSDGNHVLTVRGRDAAGNWSATGSATLVVDKTGPAITGLSVTPNPTNGAARATLTGTAVDAAGGVARVEWFVGTDPGVGNANTATLGAGGSFTTTIDTGAIAEGNRTVLVRAIDTLGNPASSTVVLQVRRPLWFSTSGNSNPPGLGGSADDADIYGYTFGATPEFARVIDATAAPYNLPGNVNVDGFTRVDATHFYVSFAGNVNLPGIAGAVQDEDVVWWNNGTWVLFFDGSAHGNMTTNVDAISVVGGGLYFSLSTNTAPTGVSGGGDDADIYYWAGGTANTYSRVVDATGVGLAGNVNVDGFVWRSATDWLMSFSGNTTITGLGAVQDEDVVRRTTGAWSTYFDGTAHGLTNNNQDVDAFDIP